MSTYSAGDPGGRDPSDRVDTRTARRGGMETKPSFKTTELLFYILAVIGVFIASALVDERPGGQGFGADKAWLYLTLLTIGYMVSRGLAKAGSRDRDD
jgi:hypothetical protein